MNMKKISVIAAFLIYFFCLLFTSICADSLSVNKRLLIINSYHKGYEWSDVITNVIIAYFNKHAPEVNIKVAYMDTKRNNSEKFAQIAGLKIKKLIESWKPDAVVASDDGASKYVISPYFLNSGIPFVFCGLNDDPATYGFPGKNVTGICESDLVESVYNHLIKYARGKKIGYLTADKDTQHVMAEINEKQMGRKFDKIYFVKNFEDWKKYFLIIQNEVDMLFMQDTCVVNDWDREKAKEFVQKHTKIPTGATADVMREYVLVCIYKSSREHGLWAAEAALKIIKGTSPADIPVAVNKEGHLVLNLKLADKLNIVFSPTMLRAAEEIIKE
ncbi:MAG: ABC transporter substrate binding protein [Candidatus Omnitrophica bacterium]|nr:ABC transporter substrate binding protein [Candidatus Omnitrophota bacterium]